MRYLFGDSSAFPLNINFIDTLSAATDTCVALLMADAELQRARQTAEEATTLAASELGDLDALEKRFGSALGGDRDRLSKATQKVVSQVLDDAKRRFESARAGVRNWRDATLHKAHERCGPASVLGPLHHFFVHHELPYTTWGLRWKAGTDEEPVQAQVYAIMQRGLTATLAVNIPDKHIWARPFKISLFEKKLVIQLKKKGLLGGEKMRDEDLARYYITRVTRTSEREALILSKKAKEPSDGLRISMREGESKRMVVVRIDENEVPNSEPVVLEGLDAAAVKRLWARVEETILDLVAYRSHLLQAQLYGKSVTELESPSMAALAIVQSIAPIVRDMGRHSPTQNELSLKRELGDGRREELFISHEEIVRKFARLPVEQRELFDAFGLQGGTARPSSRGAPASEAPQSIKIPSSYPPPPVSVMGNTLPPGHVSPFASGRGSQPALPPPAEEPGQEAIDRPQTVIPPPQAPPLPRGRRTSAVEAVSERRPVALPPPSVPPPKRRPKSGPNLRAANG